MATTSVQAALDQYHARQDRAEHPEGEFDKAGRFYPSLVEEQDCCRAIRGPSRAHPYSYMVHCRTAAHVAALNNLTPAEIKEYNKALKLERMAKSAITLEQNTNCNPVRCYKVVAVTEDSKLVSVYNGITEYQIGEKLIERAKDNHSGGYYAYPTLELARNAAFPDDSTALNLPRVILECIGAGVRQVYDNNKIAFTTLEIKNIVAAL